jgi:DNA-directed RNA polymerase specialized sigma24 family protein
MVTADDAWSDAFLSALEVYPCLQPDANVETWLVTIAYRKAIDITRQAARRPEPVGEAPSGSVASGYERDLDLVRSVATEVLSPKAIDFAHRSRDASMPWLSRSAPDYADDAVHLRPAIPSAGTRGPSIRATAA